MFAQFHGTGAKTLEVNIPEQLTLTVSLRGSREVRDGYQLFRLTGQLDAFSEPAFRRVMVRCIDEGPVHLILDLSTIDFIDSSGLGVLVQIAKKIQANQGSLRIVTNPRVTQTVKLVRLEQFLSLVTSLEEALDGLLAPPPTPIHAPASNSIVVNPTGIRPDLEPPPDKTPEEIAELAPESPLVGDPSLAPSLTNARTSDPNPDDQKQDADPIPEPDVRPSGDAVVASTPDQNLRQEKAPAKRSRTKARAKTKEPDSPEVPAAIAPPVVEEVPAVTPSQKAAKTKTKSMELESSVELDGALLADNPEKKLEARSRRPKKAPSAPSV